MSQKLTQAVAKIVGELESFASEERHRIVNAAMALLGEGPKRIHPEEGVIEPGDDHGDGLPAKARSWMKQQGLTFDQISHVFHIENDSYEIISQIPGGTRKEQVRNAYVLCGIGRLLISGESKFDDKFARSVCESGGFFDSTNHMKYMKGSEFAGSREKGWVLTMPGLKRGAVLVTQLGKT